MTNPPDNTVPAVREGMQPPTPPLSLLLDGYFHEDFRAEHSDHEGAARAFANEASSGELAEATAALDAFLRWAEGVSRETWQAALHETGGAWRPRSLGPLREVLAVFARDD